MFILKHYKKFEEKLKTQRCKKCKYSNHRLCLGYPNELRYKNYCEYLNEEINPNCKGYCLYFEPKNQCIDKIPILL